MGIILFWNTNVYLQVAQEQPPPHPPFFQKHIIKGGAHLHSNSYLQSAGSIKSWSSAKLSSEGRRLHGNQKASITAHSEHSACDSELGEKHFRMQKAKRSLFLLSLEKCVRRTDCVLTLLWTFCCGSLWDSSAWHQSWPPWLHRKGGARSGCTSQS